jgi:catechol 2,3-dioxygenase-like lactoylglutathione lyase family enzyme
MTQPAPKPARPNIEAVSAIFTVADVGAAIAFYRDRLGLAVQWHDERPPGYAIVFRGAVSLHLQPASRNASAQAALGKSTLYVWVDDVAALNAELTAAGCPIAAPLCETPCGTQEFAVRDPDGNGLSFAQNISGESG